MTHSIPETGQDAIKVSGAVSAALAAGRPVVALESTIFSQLGLPAPANRDALRRCLAALREGGAEPAVTHIGLWGAEAPELADSDGSHWWYGGVARRA